jgi:hypothetical protein
MSTLAGFNTLPAVDEGGLSGGESSPGREFFNYSKPVTLEGTISTIDINMLEAATSGGLTIKVWRVAGSSLNYISESSLPALTTGVNNGVSLETPLDVLAGDIIGIHIAANNGRVGRAAAAADSIKWNGGSASDYTANISESTISSGLAYEIAFRANGTPAEETDPIVEVLLSGFDSFSAADSVGSYSGGDSAPGRDFFSYSHTVQTSGVATSLNIEMFEGGAGLKIKQWRLVDGSLQFIAQSSLPSLSTGVNDDVALDSPLDLVSGDLISFFVPNNGARLSRASQANTSDAKWNGGASDYTATISETVLSTDLPYAILYSLKGEASSSSGASPSLAISSPAEQNRYMQRNASNQHTYTVSGVVSDLPANAAIRYSLDGGAYQTLDSSPSTSFSGSITVTSTQVVRVDIYADGVSYSSKEITLRAVAWILGDGQSNMASRGLNNQSLTLEAGAQTPVALKGSTFGIASDPMGIDSQAAGSWQMEFLSLLANANKSITYGFVNVAEGGTSVNRWIKSASDLYPRITSAFALTGGFEYAITLLGETDASNSMPQAEAETKYGSFIDDKKTDFGVNTYLVNFPKINYPGNDDIRAAFASLVAGNASCFDGGDLRPLDIANTGGDGVHLQTDAQLSGAANAIFTAITEGINTPPTANAGPNQSVAAGARVILDSSFSSDPDGTIVARGWVQVAGDDVALDDPNAIRPEFIAPSKESAQRISFDLVVIDDDDQASESSTVHIDVAAVEQNNILNIIDKLNFTLDNDGIVTAYPGRANRETFRFKPSSAENLILDEEGYLDLSKNDIRRIEASIVERSSVQVISSETDAIIIDVSRAHCRLGDLNVSSTTKAFDLTFTVYVGNDTKGVVMVAPSQEGNVSVKYYYSTIKTIQ